MNRFELPGVVLAIAVAACGGNGAGEAHRATPPLVAAFEADVEVPVPLVGVPSLGVVRVGGRAPCDPSHCGVWWYDALRSRWAPIGPAPFAAENAVYAGSIGRILAWRASSASGARATAPLETWSLDPLTGFWAWRATAAGPTTALEGAGAAVAWDAAAGRALLFGGVDAAALRTFRARGDARVLEAALARDTWAYDAGADAWTRRAPALSPPARAGHALVYDAAGRRVILHGGADLERVFADTWVYDFDRDAWTRLDTSPEPPGAARPALAFDPVRRVLVRFGGLDAAGAPIAETWRLDLRTGAWTRATAPTAPAVPTAHGLVWCEGAGALVLYGGEREPALPDETWSYDDAADRWEAKPATPPAAPPVRPR